ncbi:MAG TPA: hypothetical protein VMI54_03885 [Polyangiaceae bacterium]|nr:hypothetical protein [Polyangiaceae bacterium]
MTVVALAPACSSTSSDDTSSGGTGGTGATTGGTGGTGGSSGTSAVGADTCEMPPGDTTIIPSDTGWVDGKDYCNDVGVQGAWYPYGDQYGSGPGDAKCIKVGLHMPSECAQIMTPSPPPVMGFPNMNGMMTTTGTVEAILPCPASISTSGCPGNDYSNMWGAGIGFDFNADGAIMNADGTTTPGAKHTWNPAMYGVVGIAFTITGTPLNFRVEFPMQLTAAEAAMDTPPIDPTTYPNPTTDEHSAGAPYWGAQAKGDAMFPKSPVMDGVENKIFFDDTSASTGIQSPKTTLYKFDTTRMLGMQFHVVAGSATSYNFTISNIRYLRSH